MLNDIEISPCLADYDDFENNDFCFDLIREFKEDSNAPMLFKCYTGIMPYYCPYLDANGLPPEKFKQAKEFPGYL